MTDTLEEGPLSDSSDALEEGPLGDVADALEEGSLSDEANALEEGSLSDTADALEGGPLSELAGALEKGPRCDSADALEEGSLNRADAEGEGHAISDATNFSSSGADGSNEGEEGTLAGAADCSSPEDAALGEARVADAEEVPLGTMADCSSPDADALGDALAAVSGGATVHRSYSRTGAAGADEPQPGVITITAHHAQRRQADAAEPASGPQGSATGEAKAWATAAGRSSSRATRFNFIRRVSCASRAAPQ